MRLPSDPIASPRRPAALLSSKTEHLRYLHQNLFDLFDQRPSRIVSVSSIDRYHRWGDCIRSRKVFVAWPGSNLLQISWRCRFDTAWRFGGIAATDSTQAVGSCSRPGALPKNFAILHIFTCLHKFSQYRNLAIPDGFEEKFPFRYSGGRLYLNVEQI